jgi:hypothetical protein
MTDSMTARLSALMVEAMEHQRFVAASGAEYVAAGDLRQAEADEANHQARVLVESLDQALNAAAKLEGE